MESITLITNWQFDAIQSIQLFKSIQLLNQFNYFFEKKL